jgi:hypothetical protein
VHERFRISASNRSAEVERGLLDQVTEERRRCHVLLIIISRRGIYRALIVTRVATDKSVLVCFARAHARACILPASSAADTFTCDDIASVRGHTRMHAHNFDYNLSQNALYIFAMRVVNHFSMFSDVSSLSLTYFASIIANLAF